MKFELKIRFETPFVTLDKEANLEEEFKSDIQLVKMFALIYEFDIVRMEPTWGNEDEACHWMCESAYSFTLVKRFPSTGMFLVSSAVSCFLRYRGFQRMKEVLNVVEVEAQNK